MSKCGKCGGWKYPYQHGTLRRLRDDPGYNFQHETGGPVCLERQLAQSLKREATEKARADSAEAVLQAARWDATRHLARADSAEAILRAANFCEAHLPDPGEPEKHCPACLAVHENDLRVKAEAERNRLMLELDSLQCDVASALGWDCGGVKFATLIRGYVMAHEIERAKAKRLREAFNAAVRRPMGVVPAGDEEWYDAKEAPVPVGHVCGLSGFGQPGDRCQACENNRKRWRRAKEADDGEAKA